jgi:molybdenum cofactor cytidylyltransferase
MSITGLVLAAGTSSRFGRTKQLFEVSGRPLVQHALDAAAEAGLDEIVVVLGHDAEAVEAALHLPPTARVVRNPRYAEGQSTSLATGLNAARAESEGAVVLLADQPGISAEHVRALVTAFRARRARIVRLSFRDGPGPALLSREIWAEATHLTGDTGARALVAEHPDWIEEIAVDEDAPPDVDTPADAEGLP